MIGQTLYKEHPRMRSQFFLLRLARGALAVMVGCGVLFLLNKAEILSPAISFLLMAALGIVVAVVLHIIRKSIVYTVTAQTVRKDAGIIRRTREEFSIRKVQSIDVEQNIFERFVLRTGNVAFDSAAGDSIGSAEVVFAGIPQPHNIADMVRNADSNLYSGQVSEGYQNLRQGERSDPSYTTGTEDESGPQPYRGLPPR